MELSLTRTWESSAPGPLLASDFSLQIKDCLVHQMGAGLANTVQKNFLSAMIMSVAVLASHRLRFESAHGLMWSSSD